MITLITGLPGNGKTLFALWWLKMKSEKEQREVYYNNIKDLNLPWTAFEAEKWMDVPHGSLVVFDEGQFVFAKKPNGSKLPDFYEKLATHRHLGLDIVIITQHPTLLDNFVRQLVGQHYHCVRKFGMERSTIYEWAAANPAPQNIASQKSAISLKWKFPKEVYTYYKSAEVHTVKRAIPAKLVLAALFVVAVVVAGYLKLGHMGAEKKNDAAAVVANPFSPGVGSSSSSSSAVARFDPASDAREFVAMNTPRVQGLPQTAPRYDGLTKPSHVPVPAACIQSGDAHPVGAAPRCKCFTQQGTPMDVSLGMCLEFARNGFFQDFDPDKDAAGSARADRGVQTLSARPDASPVHPQDGGSSVLAFAEVPALPRARGAPQVQAPNSDGAPNGGRGRALPPIGSPSPGG